MTTEKYLQNDGKCNLYILYAFKLFAHFPNKFTEWDNLRKIPDQWGDLSGKDNSLDMKCRREGKGRWQCFHITEELSTKSDVNWFVKPSGIHSKIRNCLQLPENMQSNDNIN